MQFVHRPQQSTDPVPILKIGIARVVLMSSSKKYAIYKSSGFLSS